MITTNQENHLIASLSNDFKLLLHSSNQNEGTRCKIFGKYTIWNDKQHHLIVSFNFVNGKDVVSVELFLYESDRINLLASATHTELNELIRQIRYRTVDQHECTSYHLETDYEEIVKVFNMFNIEVKEMISARKYIQQVFGIAHVIFDTLQIFENDYHITVSESRERFIIKTETDSSYYDFTKEGIDEAYEDLCNIRLENDRCNCML